MMSSATSYTRGSGEAEPRFSQIRSLREHAEYIQAINDLRVLRRVSWDGILARPRDSRHNRLVHD